MAEMESVTAAYLVQCAPQFDVSISNYESDQEQGHAVKIQVNFSTSQSPLFASVMIGDIIHNLRTSLDLMASELARPNNTRNLDVYFPFASNESELESQIKRKNFYLAGKDAVDLLKSFQPYRGGNLNLRALHDLDIQDKHRTLVLNAMTFASPVIMILDENNEPCTPQIVGDPTKATDVRLVFPEGAIFGNCEAVPIMHSLVQLVTSVVESFASLRGYSLPCSDRSAPQN